MAQKKSFPKAKDIVKALLHIPRWKSGVAIDPRLVERFDINPGQIGALSQETMELEKAKTEGALLQLEMATEFFEWLELRLGVHEEIEELRSKAQQLMFETIAREDASAMNAILAGTKYQQHYEVWQHQLKGEQQLLRDKAEREKATVNVDLAARLTMAYNAEAKKQAAIEVKVTNSERVKEVDTQELAEKKLSDDELKAARANFEKRITR